MSRSRDRTFHLLAEAARTGARCPKKGEIPWGKDHVAMLARLGHIRIEIYARNWRVVEIMTGPHAGKRTAPAPFPEDGSGKPYRVIARKEPLTSADARRVLA